MGPSPSLSPYLLQPPYFQETNLNPISVSRQNSPAADSGSRQPPLPLRFTAQSCWLLLLQFHHRPCAASCFTCSLPSTAPGRGVVAAEDKITAASIATPSRAVSGEAARRRPAARRKMTVARARRRMPLRAVSGEQFATSAM
jgi:hypothetical protein